MNDPSWTWRRKTCADLLRATSSRASADGRMPDALPDGPMTGRGGPAPAPVSHSASLESKLALTTSGISGLSGSDLSPSESLQSSLESRLRERLIGSDLCEVIWKPWDTPWGPRLSKPRARVRTTNGIVSGLWPTATATDGLRHPHPDFTTKNITLNHAALWSTPRSSDAEKGSPNQSFGGGGQPLPAQAYQAAMWPTATHTGITDRSSPVRICTRRMLAHCRRQRAGLLASWAMAHVRGRKSQAG